MSTYKLSDVEKEMANYNFDALNASAQTAKANIAKAQTAADLKSEVCKVWSKIPDSVKKLLRDVPFIGKYFSIIADVLDSLCAG
jgi:hypothetical protein